MSEATLTTPPEAESLAAEHADWARRIAAIKASRVPPKCRDDVESAAMLGLWQAARRFDPAKGVKFRSFAKKFVLGRMNDALAKWLPKGYRRCEGRSDPPRTVSIDDAGPGDRPMADALADHREESRSSCYRERFMSAVRGLSPQYRDVFAGFYLEGGTVADVARRLNLRTRRVERILSEASSQLREDPDFEPRLIGDAGPPSGEQAMIQPLRDSTMSDSANGLHRLNGHAQFSRPACVACGKPTGVNGRCYKCKPPGRATGQKGGRPSGKRREPPAKVAPPGEAAATPESRRAARTPASAPILAELDAMRAIAVSLAELDPEARRRVIAWADGMFPTASVPAPVPRAGRKPS